MSNFSAKFEKACQNETNQHISNFHTSSDCKVALFECELHESVLSIQLLFPQMFKVIFCHEHMYETSNLNYFFILEFARNEGMIQPCYNYKHKSVSNK